MGKTQNHQHQDQKVKNPSKKVQEKIPKTQKGPGSVQDIKTKNASKYRKSTLQILGATGKLSPKVGEEEKRPSPY